MPKLEYTEEIEVQGIRIPFVKNIIVPGIERQMRIGNYEAGECGAVHKYVQPGDRILELGAGVGLVGAATGKVEGVERVVSIEANPELIDLITETHRINGITNVELRHGIVAPKNGKDIPFYLRKQFWASSMEPDSRPYREKITMQAFGLKNLLNEIKPTVIMADIEGGELDIFDNVDLVGVRTVIIETHPHVYGHEGQRKILKFFDDQGFRAEKEYLAGSVWVLSRQPIDAAPRFLTRGPTDPSHNLEDPKFLITTCMKNEGPFILEWIAYHRSIGVQEFVIFSNDCTDGTDAMLDRLDELGIVTHLPNPAKVAGSTYFQPIAMKFAMNMRQVRAADYVIESDVDEFIAIKAGSGHLTDLLRAAGPFHVLSISEVNFCSSGHWAFSDGWLTENFREHETPTPGHWQARRGVKSIIHGIDNFENWPVHRPSVFPGTQDQLIWLDGSGKPLPEDFIVNHENGIDRRGRYDLVQLDHHPLRSAQSFLLKQVRGDVVNAKNNVDMHYYRKRALGGHRHGVIDRSLPRAREEWNKLMQDPQLTEIHKASVAFHEDAALRAERNPALAELRDWIQQTYFPDLAT